MPPVGTSAEIEALAGPETTTVDVGGRMLMPGIHDTHAHPTDAGIQQTLECSFLTFVLDEALDALRECIAATPEGEWVRGGQWNDALLASGRMPKDILDEIAPNHPVFLMDWSVHNGWVNSLALEKFGIDASTPDPDLAASSCATRTPARRPASCSTTPPTTNAANCRATATNR